MTSPQAARAERFAGRFNLRSSDAGENGDRVAAFHGFGRSKKYASSGAPSAKSRRATRPFNLAAVAQDLVAQRRPL